MTRKNADGRRLNIYLCSICGGYHIGHVGWSVEVYDQLRRIETYAPSAIAALLAWKAVRHLDSDIEAEANLIIEGYKAFQRESTSARLRKQGRLNWKATS